MDKGQPLAAELAREWVRRLVPGAREFEMYDKQRAFVMSGAHHLAFIAGIGSGKSMAGAMRGIRAAQGFIGEGRIPTPNMGVVTAPTYNMLDDATIRTFLALCDEYVVGFDRDTHYKQHHLTLPNGSEILFRSTQHPDRLRGPSISWWMGDEAALSPATARRLMVGRLRQFGQLGYEWVTTTPKGRNWVWQTFVRDAGEDYDLVRARTDENTYLMAEVIDTWEREYTGDFARQELGGEFVAFEGLIYADFSHTAHVVDELPGGFARVVAGVDWGYANPGVILVLGQDGDGRLWLVDERVATQRRVEEWAQIAVQVRDTWGVRTFYCDPSEPDYIAQFKAVGVKAEGADNRVLPGIQRVQDRLVVPPGRKPGLVVHGRCVRTLAEFDQYQWAENRHGIKDEPVKANDHCFVAGTKIITNRGKVPIEEVTTNDKVLTRDGFKHVVFSDKTQDHVTVHRVQMSNGNFLEGTGSHPVFVLGEGFVTLDSLRYGNMLFASRDLIGDICQHQNLRLWCTRGSSFADTQTQKDIQTRCTLSPVLITAKMVLADCIKKFTKTILVKYPKAMKYIIKMVITSITSHLIWKQYQNLNTESITLALCQSGKRNGFANACPSYKPKPETGTVQTKAKSGIVNTANGHGKIESLLKTSVNGVMSHMKQNHMVNTPNSAQTNVEQQLVERVVLMTNKESVSLAGQVSQSTNTANKDSVPVHVVAVTMNVRKADVYNLTVEGKPEYFANGVLVHNCMDALRYAVMGVDERRGRITATTQSYI